MRPKLTERAPGLIGIAGVPLVRQVNVSLWAEFIHRICKNLNKIFACLCDVVKVIVRQFHVMVKVKICGITNLEDALAAADAGADALGFVFYKNSPRYITPIKAKNIIKSLPKKILKVGVFVDAQERTIKRIARLCRLDMLQFHGSESPEFCRRFSVYKVIKAFRVRDKIDCKDILKYETFAYLFDSFVQSKPGGSGKKFDWSLIKRIIDKMERPVFLSGGLSENNVREAIGFVKSDWVDVSSSVELRPGKKDIKKIKEFLRAVKKA